MFCSVIIPTIGRETLARAVNSVLDQHFADADVEVIVVNDSGRPLPPTDWQASDRVRVLTTQRRERSVARNVGAAAARGAYLAFLDDDDRLLPQALGTFWQLAQSAPRAVWLYGGIEVVDEAGDLLGRSNAGLSGECFAWVMGGAWMPIQASFIRSEAFFAAGGYDPLITGTEDLDLCRRLALRGEFAGTAIPVACLLRGRSWDTATDYQRAPRDTLFSRDQVLAQPGAYRRLLTSMAKAGSAYWAGRTVRVVLSTARHNVRDRRYLTALSRALLAAVCGLRAGTQCLTSAFWAGARADHVPGSLHALMLEYDRRRVGAAQPAFSLATTKE